MSHPSHLAFAVPVGEYDDLRKDGYRLGDRIARELDVPIFYYGAASEPPGRSLAELRRGSKRDLAVMFIDIRGSTGIAERIGAAAIFWVGGATLVAAFLFGLAQREIRER